MPFEEPLVFKVDWFDPSSSINRRFNLSFYQSDNSVEMFDVNTRKLFLRRCHVSKLSKSDFYVGNTVVVFSRHLVIKECANEYTKEQVEDEKQCILMLVYPEAHDNLGHILDSLERGGFSLCRARTMKFTLGSAQEFWQNVLDPQDDMGFLASRLANFQYDVPTTAFEIVGPSAVSKWKDCLRPVVPMGGESEEQGDLNIRGIYGSRSLASAEWELQFIFNQKAINVQPDPPVKLCCGPDVTCCIIKPHILRENQAGRIIHDIQLKGFHVFGLQSFVLSKSETEDFFEIYKGIPNADYSGLVKQVASGRCLVLALSRGPGLNLTEETPSVVAALRKACGPSDPDVCRVLYPDSLRAKYGGLTIEENAIHCSDLEEDGLMEVEYFFTLMQPYQSV